MFRILLGAVAWVRRLGFLLLLKLFLETLTHSNVLNLFDFDADAPGPYRFVHLGEPQFLLAFET